MISRRQCLWTFLATGSGLTATVLASRKQSHAVIPLPIGVQEAIKALPLVPLEGAVAIANQMSSLNTLLSTQLTNAGAVSDEELKRTLATEVGDRFSIVTLWVNSVLAKQAINTLPLSGASEAVRSNVWLSAHSALIAYHATHVAAQVRPAMLAKLDDIGLERFKRNPWPHILEVMAEVHTCQLGALYHPKQLASLPQDVATLPQALRTRRFFLANAALLAQQALPFCPNTPLAGNTGVARFLALWHRQTVVGAKQVAEASPVFKEAVHTKAAANVPSYVAEGVVNSALQAGLKQPWFEGLFSDLEAMHHAQAVVGLLGGIAARMQLGNPLQQWFFSGGPLATAWLGHFKNLVRPLGPKP